MRGRGGPTWGSSDGRRRHVVDHDGHAACGKELDLMDRTDDPGQERYVMSLRACGRCVSMQRRRR